MKASGNLVTRSPTDIYISSDTVRSGYKIKQAVLKFKIQSDRVQNPDEWAGHRKVKSNEILVYDEIGVKSSRCRVEKPTYDRMTSIPLHQTCFPLFATGRKKGSKRRDFLDTVVVYHFPKNHGISGWNHLSLTLRNYQREFLEGFHQFTFLLGKFQRNQQKWANRSR